MSDITNFLTTYSASMLVALAITFFFAIYLYLYYYYIRKKDYTRERFAFVSLASFTVFTLSLLPFLLVPNTSFGWFIKMANSYLNTNIPAYKEENLLANIFILVFCLLMYYVLVRTLFLNWNGKKSEEQALNEATNNDAQSIWGDAKLYRKKNGKFVVYVPPPKKENDVFPSEYHKKRAWHIKAAALLKLHDYQYQIDTETDWYVDAKTYIAKYGHHGEKAAILCLETEPTTSVLEKYLYFVAKQKQKGLVFAKYTIAINANGQRKTEHLQDAITGFEYVEIDCRYESEMLDNFIDKAFYLNNLKPFFETKQINGVSLNEMYVPLSAREKVLEKDELIDKAAEIENVEKFVLQWINDDSLQRQHLAILGEYGQGKSVLMKKIAKTMLEQPENYQRIPILVELGGSSPRTMTANDMLSKCINAFSGGDAKKLLELHKAGKLLFIFDGFDEMDLVGDTELLFSHFRSLWQFTNEPNAKIIIAGRPNLFTDNKERRKALGIRPPRLNAAYTRAIYLNQLNAAQVEQVLDKVTEKTKLEILDAQQQAGERSSFAELIRRPSTLFQLSAIWDSEMAINKNKLNSATVIGKFIEKSYERQQSKEKLNSERLTSIERNYFLIGIAINMMLKNDYTNKIKANELRATIELLWNQYPEKLSPYQTTQDGQKASLKIRLKNNKHALETITRDVMAGGILVQDLSGSDVFRFSHKSYMEYLVSAFYATFILKSKHDTELFTITNTVKEVFNFKANQLAASEDVERFAAEIIVEQIELKDADDNVKPIEAHKEEYLSAIFEKVMPTRRLRLRKYAFLRPFLNIAAWCNIHPMQKWLIGIFIIACICLLSVFMIDFDTENEGLQWSLAILSILLYLSIYILIVKDKLHLEKKEPEKMYLPPYKYAVYIRLYGQACIFLEKNCVPTFPATYYELMKEAGKPISEKIATSELYRVTVLHILAIFIFFAFAFAGAVAGAVAFAGAGAVLFLEAEAGTSAFVFTFTVVAVVGRVVAGAVVVAGVGAITVAGVGAIAFAVEGVVAVAVAAAVFIIDDRMKSILQKLQENLSILKKQHQEREF
ncbi:MAG: NACHT domain-containing protein [Chitinophagales bacterium]